MVDLVTAAEFDAETDLPDWRVVLGRIEATFVARSFGAVVRAFAHKVADAADAADTDHHPDLDLRYPGIVHVVLTTHVAWNDHSAM